MTITLAVLLAFTVAVAAVLPQLPGVADPLAAARWLATTSARYGRFGPLFSSSGLFNILAGPWIITLLALSAFHLALRAVNQVRRLAVRASGVPAAPQGLPFELVHVPLGVDAVHDRVEALASGRHGGGAVVADPTAPWPRVDAYFERRRWAVVGPLLTYLGALLVLLGLVWNTVAGWRVTDVTLIPGRTVQPAEAGGLALSLVDPGGAEGEAAAVVSLARGNQAHDDWLGYARPARWGSVWIARRSSGPALAVRAKDGNKALPVQSLEGETAPADSLRLRFAQNESEQAFTIPARNLAFRVVSYESLADRGIDRPVFLVEGFQGTDTAPALNALVEGSKTIEWQGVELTLQREAYVVVDLAAMPGLPLLLLGGLVLLAGVGIAGWAGLTRTWVNAAVDGDGTLLAVRAAAPALGQAEVSRVAASLVAPVEAGNAASPRSKAAVRHVLYTLAGAIVFALAGGLSLRSAGVLAGRSQTWILFVYVALALLGLGALLAGAGQSLWFALRGSRLSDVADPTLPGPLQGLRSRPGDPGRGVGLAAFPLLTLAILLGGVWGLFVFASPVRPVAGQMWLLAAWLFASGYFHATSGWRPMRTPAWLAPILAMAAVAAGIAACVAAPSLFSL